MPVEIRELIIRATVVPDSQDGGSLIESREMEEKLNRLIERKVREALEREFRTPGETGFKR